MCGIVGFSGRFESALLTRMNSSIAHRGPDGDGVFYDEECGVGLAHRRLAIIDLSSTGHQPMLSEDRSTVIVFNGEVYNFRELGEELIRKGHSFRGNSDTEVLLNLYLQEGTDMLRRLNGIFAFAIWSSVKRELFVARDGMGVKPLYYATTPLGVVFASEIKALLQEASVSTAINPAAIVRHLTFLWSPAPETILKSVHKLEPGMGMILRDGKVARKWSYYDLPYGKDRAIRSENDACDLLRSALDRAVGRQMVADVPVGAFLSGGLDSSAVVAYARRHTRERLQCFTIAFSDTKAGADEGMTADLPYAKRVAHHLDVDLHTITVGPEMSDHVEEMIFHLDEPQADPAPLNALFISKFAREHGIKVLLSGAGGDDILTGYRRHYALSLERYWAFLPSAFRHGMTTLAGQIPPKYAGLRRIRKAFEYSGLDGDHRLASYFFWLDPAKARDLLAPELRCEADQAIAIEPLLLALESLPKGATKLDRMLYLETKFFLPDHNLNYTDKMSMAHGLEVRVPLLDPDLVALAARFPDDMKQRGATGKWVFKKAMEGLLPNDVIYRPKTGFGAPLRRWLRHELRPMVEDVLAPASVKRRGLFDPDAVTRLILKDRMGKIDASYTIFSLICIELWCRIFLDSQPAQLLGRSMKKH
jgi:asparagine synthase (glutamine-hydrolysing)